VNAIVRYAYVTLGPYLKARYAFPYVVACKGSDGCKRPFLCHAQQSDLGV